MRTTMSTLATRLPDSTAGPKDTAGWYFISEAGESYLPEGVSDAVLAALQAEYESDGLPYTIELCSEA